MKALSEFPPEVVEIFGYHEALRRLGFLPDDIFVLYGAGALLSILRTQGMEMAFRIKPMSFAEYTKLAQEYLEMVENINGGRYSSEELSVALKRTMPFQMASVFVAEVVKFGFQLPVAHKPPEVDPAFYN